MEAKILVTPYKSFEKLNHYVNIIVSIWERMGTLYMFLPPYIYFGALMFCYIMRFLK